MCGCVLSLPVGRVGVTAGLQCIFTIALRCRWMQISINKYKDDLLVGEDELELCCEQKACPM